MNEAISTYLAEMGRRGGRKSRRWLEPEEARRMVLMREARRAFLEFHSVCFWSSPIDLDLRPEDVSWIVAQLRRHGGQSGWLKAARLCR